MSRFYDIINPKGKSPWVIICEHAGNFIPEHLKKLGLSTDDINRHIAYDIGAYEASLNLAKQLDATAIVCHVSRLVIDCNRPIHQAIVKTSDETIIPGNQLLSQQDKLWRIEKIFKKFHQVVFDVIAQKMAHCIDIKIANIHSFTPKLNTENTLRPWDIGFIYKSPHPSVEIMHYIKQQSTHIVGENQPYSAAFHQGFTIPFHAHSQNIPYILVEFRQDFINTHEGVNYWTNLLSSAIKKIN